MNIPQFEEIVEPNDQTAARREHLEKLRELVGNVYPNKFERSKISGEADTISSLIRHEPVAAASREMADSPRDRTAPVEQISSTLRRGHD